MAKSKPLIYVQIPAYRDTELAKTLEQILDKAAYPDRLRIAVLWQHGPGEKLPPSILAKKNIEIEQVPHTKSKGCNWARIQIQQRWKGEPYTLFLDSHHRFVRDWEELTVEMYEQLRSSGVNKPIITAYLPSYNPANDPGERMRTTLKTYFLERTAGILTRITSYEITGWKRLSKPIPADYLSLHFLFTAGIFNKEIPFDPQVYFTGDEVMISLRAYTHGYDLYHPHRILGWHEYKRATRVTHWDDHENWWKKEAASLFRMRSVFTGKYRGRFGAGKKRSIKDFEEHIGQPLYVPVEDNINAIV